MDEEDVFAGTGGAGVKMIRRIVWYMLYTHVPDLTYAEIGRHFGIERDTVCKNIHKYLHIIKDDKRSQSHYAIKDILINTGVIHI